VQARWSSLIERCLKTICKKCTNKARIEASIAEASIREEVSNFMTSYYKPNLPSKHNPPPRYNAGEVESTLSLFKGQLGSTRDWIQNSGTESHYMCSPTLLRLRHSLSKFLTNLFQYDVTILYRTPLILFGTGNLFIKSGINQGILPHTNMIPFFQRVWELGGLISFLGSNKRYFPI
jgi:hypothetical protein